MVCRKQGVNIFVKTVDFWYLIVYNTKSHIGVWRSLVSRLVRDQEAMGSSPVTPTIFYESIHFKVSAFLLAVGPEPEGPGITTEALAVWEQLKNIRIVDYF